MAREFKYKGLDWDDLWKADQATLEHVFNARGRRTLKRMKGLDKKIKRNIEENLKGKPSDKPIRTHRRDLIITPNMVGLKFAVYDGKIFQTVGIKKEMIGHYLGEFVDTRKRPQHSKAGIGATKSSKHIGKK